MQPIILDNEHQPSSLIQNYDSFIWTERFYQCGDFQLTSGNIAQHWDTLIEGTRISLVDSEIVMEVETRHIERKKGAADVLKITGRSLESVLDRRVAISSLAIGDGEWSVVAKQPSDVAYFIMKWVCVDGRVSEDDIFPSSQLRFLQPSDYMSATGPNRAFTVPRGNLLNAVQDLAGISAAADGSTTPATPEVLPHGVRCRRPGRGDTAASIELYTGVDRRGEVYFSARKGMLDDGNYYFTKSGSANVAYILGPATATAMNANPYTPSGFDRRVILVDGSSSGIDTDAAMRTEGALALAAAAPTAIFDGDINPDVNPYLYGADYGLGDLVKLQGDYGLDEIAMVTEFIRSHDENGVRSYPTLTTYIDQIPT